MILIIFFLIISTIYSLWYIINSNTNDLCSMFYAVALSYIAAFIFYLLQVYFPESKKTNSVNRIVKSRLESIVNKVEELYKELFKLYIPNCNKDTDVVPLMKNLLNIDLNDYTTIGDIEKINSSYNNGQNKYKTVKEVTTEMVLTFVNNMDYLYKTFPGYLSSEVIDILEKMRHSLFMQIVPFQIKHSVNANFSSLNQNIFEEFWCMNNELKQCKNRIISK